MRFLLALCLPLVLMLGITAAESKEDTADLELLKSRGIAADNPGLLRYLRSLQVGADQRKEIQALIRHLGSEDFEERESATSRLSALALVAAGELEAARRSKDPERSMRAAEILEKIDSTSKPLFLAVLRVVKQRRPAGVTAELLKLLPSFPDDVLRPALQEALAASATAQDAEVLRSALEAKEVEVRLAALTAYERVLGAKAVAEVRKHLQDADEQVRLVAVRALARHEPRACLEVLLKLLDADSVKVRADSDAMLRSLTGQRFGFVAYAELPQRRTAVAGWRDWVGKNGQTAKLGSLTSETPLPTRLLLCLFEPSASKEIDWSGKEVFTTDRVNTGCGCQLLANGHRVFADWGTQEVVEVDAAGKEVWRKKVPGTPNSLHRLSDGNTLVGLHHEQKVVELNRAGTIVWQADVKGLPTDTRRLENGHTLVALFRTNRVVELDRKGKEVWSVENVESAESARRLPNGNTLIACSSGAVIEYDPDGKRVWSANNLPRAFDAVLLANGNILVAYGKGLRELDRNGKTIREIAVGVVRRIGVE